MLSRRNMLQGLAAGAGAAFGLSVLPQSLLAAPASPSGASSGGPKRIVFFLQNQGFDPAACIPEGMKSSGSLAKAKLP